jgi:2-polyprenyl-6-hydroxyphenyl methylase/3-demethylubiquinone-9 3-methyltransferase
MFRFRAPARTNVIDIYDDHADAWWNFDDNRIFEPLHAVLRARAAYLDDFDVDVSGRVVVDVGAGGGYVSGLLRDRGARVVGVDVARRALLAARSHPGPQQGASYAEASALALPIADASVDVVVCTDVLVHLPLSLGGPARAIAEVGRVLKPGGLFWFSTINSTWLARFVLITLGEDLLGFVHKGTHDPETFLSPTQMDAHLATAGLDVVARRGFGPVGLTSRLGLKMGAHPTLAGMWQGHARKRPA